MYSGAVIVLHFAALIHGLGCGIQVEMGRPDVDGFYERTHMYDGRWGFTDMHQNLLQWGDAAGPEAWEIKLFSGGVLVGTENPGTSLYPPTRESWEYYTSATEHLGYKDVIMDSNCKDEFEEEGSECGVTITAGDSEIDGRYEWVWNENGKGKFQKVTDVLHYNDYSWEVVTSEGVMSGMFGPDSNYVPPTGQTWAYMKEDNSRQVFENVQVVSDCPAKFLSGETGVDACPNDSEPIRDHEVCIEAATSLGLTYSSDFEDGDPDAVCYYCGGCHPDSVVSFDKNHLDFAEWICQREALSSVRKANWSPAAVADIGSESSSSRLLFAACFFVSFLFGCGVTFMCTAPRKRNDEPLLQEDILLEKQFQA